MITFKKHKDLLILTYSAHGGNDWVFEIFDDNEALTLRNTFTFKRKDLFSSTARRQELNEDDDLDFILGQLEGEYYRIKKEIVSTSHDIYIYKSVRLEVKLFVAEKNVSVLAKIDRLVGTKIRIGGPHRESLPEEEYKILVSKFPNKYELHLYVEARLSTVLRNYFDTTPDNEGKYNRYLNKKESLKGENLLIRFSETEIEKYLAIEGKLEGMLLDEQSYNETQWQKEILQILLLLYPKYIQVFREAPVHDTYYATTRKIDYLLVDSSGHIDIVEIKRPFDNSIVTKAQYRDNYIPLRELSGTIMQIEKYIFNLNRWGRKGERILSKKYKELLPPGFQVKIINPSGLIIMGRDNALTIEQKLDFEVIKRKYKNVIDIITYDDLLKRLKFTITQLRRPEAERIIK